VSKAGGEPRGCCRTVFCLILCEKLGNKFCRHASHSKILRQYRLACAKWQLVFISNLSDRQTSVLTDYLLHWHGKQSLVRAVDGRPVCGSSYMDVRPFLNREYHSNVLDRLNAVSPNACCSISHISVAVFPSFW
jgi:hypothetical protein